MTRMIAALFLLSLSAPVSLGAATVHVPADQPTIQAGIDAAAPGDSVIVADGVYTGEGNRDIEFNGKAVTLRSANGPASCIIDCQGSEGNEHRGFRIWDEETADTVVEGFTIRNGYAGTGGNYGGGIFCNYASPTIRNNIFLDNQGGFDGSGIYLYHSTSLVTGNHFEGNGANGRGSGVFVNESSATLDGNTFVNNSYFPIYCRTQIDDEATPVITNNLISGNISGIYCYRCSPLIEGNTIIGNQSEITGGGILATTDSAPEIRDNLISNNTCSRGGGIYATGGSIIGNRIIDNTSTGEGGGLYLSGYSDNELVVRDNLIQGNRALGPTFYSGGGGGIFINDGSPLVENNLVVGNQASAGGGGVRVFYNYGPAPTLVHNTIAWNVAGGTGGGIQAYNTDGPTLVRNCILYHNSPGEIALEEGGQVTVSYSDIQGGYTGTGNINSDPLFTTGPQGDFYLCQTAAGQAAQSPCVDAGDPADATPAGTTRTDGVPDSGRADMGYHYRSEPPETIIVHGPEGTVYCPVLTFTYTGEDDEDPPGALRFSHRLDSGSWTAWSAAALATFSGLGEGVHLFEVRARDTAGNVDPTPAESTFIVEPWQPPDGIAGLVVGPGPLQGNPPLVRTSSAQWLAYGVMRYGVNVACGNIDGSGLDEVLTGPGPGPQFGPQVRGWTPDGAALPGVNFFAYGTLRYGVNVAAGDIDGDGCDEIVTGAGPGAVFGPHVRGWNVDGGSASPIGDVSYFAYGTLRWGVNVTAGDIDGDGYDEMVTGAGPGEVFGAHVRGWDYDGGPGVSAIPAVSYFAYGTPKYGVNVACGDIDGDGIDEIITGPGPGVVFGSHIRAWDFQGGTVSQVPGASWFAYPTTLYGARVGAADVDGDGIDEIITVPGPDPSSGVHVRGWNANGGTVTPVSAVSFLAFDPWVAGGGSVAGGNLE